MHLQACHSSAAWASIVTPHCPHCHRMNFHSKVLALLFSPRTLPAALALSAPVLLVERHLTVRAGVVQLGCYLPVVPPLLCIVALCCIVD
eukprot:1151959-Pelagomonas_calceolata.AAC.4